MSSPVGRLGARRLGRDLTTPGRRYAECSVLPGRSTAYSAIQFPLRYGVMSVNNNKAPGPDAWNPERVTMMTKHGADAKKIVSTRSTEYVLVLDRRSKT